MSHIILSGVSSGIGLDIAKQCLSRGDSVLGLSRHPDKAELKSPDYTPIKIDFSDLKQSEITLKQCAAQYETPDVLICNAGIGAIYDVEQLSLKKMQTVMDVNFMSQVLMIKTFLPAMKRQQSGKIIVIGSESALRGGRRGSIYCASKFALRGFCQSLRDECRSDSIAVSMIHPGLVRTPFFDDLPIQPGADTPDALTAKEVTKTVELILNLPIESVIEEISLSAIRQKVDRS